MSMAIRASLYTSHFLLSCDPLGAGSHFHCLFRTPNGRHTMEPNNPGPAYLGWYLLLQN